MKKILFSFLWISCSLGQALQEGFQKEQELERFEENVLIADIGSYAIPAALGFMIQGTEMNGVIHELVVLTGLMSTGLVGGMMQDEKNKELKVEETCAAARACWGSAIRSASKFVVFYFLGALIRKHVTCTPTVFQQSF